MRGYKTEQVPGKNKGDIFLYALSTCGWCRKTKELLKSLGVAHEYVYVDLLDEEEKEKAMADVEKLNPNRSFPTLLIGDRCIVGFKETDIREALK